MAEVRSADGRSWESKRAVGAIESFSSLQIYAYLPISLIPGSRILDKLAKFFVLEYSEHIALKSQNQNLDEKSLYEIPVCISMQKLPVHIVTRHKSL